MTPLPPVPNALRIEFETGDNASIQAGSRFFVSYSGSAPNVTDLNALAVSVKDAWTTDIAGNVNETEALHSVTITDLSSPSGAVGIWTGTVNGTNVQGSLPASSCVCVNHQINRRYRGGKPKTFIRMGTNGELDGTNKWTSGAQATYLTAWQDFVAAVLATTGISVSLNNIVNISYYEGSQPFKKPSGRYVNLPTQRVPPLVDPIVGSTIAPKLGSQRRRLNVG